MRIEDLKSDESGGKKKVSAIVFWENCDRQPHEVYFEVSDAFAQSLHCNPHAFLIACAIPALHYGEQRIFIDAEICPELRDGLTVAMGLLCQWFQPDREPIHIEAKSRSVIQSARLRGDSPIGLP